MCKYIFFLYGPRNMIYTSVTMYETRAILAQVQYMKVPTLLNGTVQNTVYKSVYSDTFSDPTLK